MELTLKCNSEGRRRFIELMEEGYEVISIDGIFYMSKEDYYSVELSTKFSDLLLKKGIIEKL